MWKKIFGTDISLKIFSQTFMNNYNINVTSDWIGYNRSNETKNKNLGNQKWALNHI